MVAQGMKKGKKVGAATSSKMGTSLRSKKSTAWLCMAARLLFVRWDCVSKMRMWQCSPLPSFLLFSRACSVQVNKGDWLWVKVLHLSDSTAG